MTRPRALLLHPPFSAYGGGECVAAWVAQCLLPSHDVTIISERRASLAKADERFATQLAGPAVTLVRRHLNPTWLKRLPGGNTLAFFLHLRALDRLHHAWRPDLWVCTEYPTWLPARGLQYLHYPRQPDGPYSLDGKNYPHWKQRLSRDLLLRSRTVTSAVPPAAHLTVANSAWTAAGVAALGLPQPHVVYPPVPPMPPGLLWSQRENRVVLLGRWSPEKRLEWAVEIVERARALGAGDLRLSLVGFWSNHSQAAARALRRRISRPWVDWHENLPRDAVGELLGRSRYGVHCMELEHFGIAIAELLTAGCVTLVPDSGGAPEIQTDPGLRYHDAEEAARLLTDLARDPDRAEGLHAACRAQGLLFSPERFVAALRPLLAAVGARNAHRAPSFKA